MERALLLARVIMPEKGVFSVRCPKDGIGKGCRAVVNLGYGPDVGVVLGTEFYDPAVHGASVPGYLLIRAASDADEREIASQRQDAARMKDAFLRLARETEPEIRILHLRLSLGRQRLFVWYAAPRRGVDLSDAAREFGRSENVQVFARQLSPREEVGFLGAVGPCGRPCCCATWQTRPAQGSGTAGRARCKACYGTAQPNGVCGRHKCCLSFEEPDNGNQEDNST